MNGIFTMMTGSLFGMIWMILYMGFKKITLVGCDYAASPKKLGHFFEFGKSENVELGYKIGDEILQSLSDRIDMVTISNKLKGTHITSISYLNYTNTKPIYKKNNKIVFKEDLKELHSLNYIYKIFEDAH